MRKWCCDFNQYKQFDLFGLVGGEIRKLYELLKDRNQNEKVYPRGQQCANPKCLTTVLGYQKDCKKLGRLVIKGQKLIEKNS